MTSEATIDVPRAASVIGAEFSPCRTWRYALWRHWDWDGHANCCMFIGLNPSTADETKDDPTIRRCIGFAKASGFGGIYMMNLYAFRATKPIDMVQAADPWGPDNMQAFGYFRTRVSRVVAAWGSIYTRWRPNLKWQSTIAKVITEVAQLVWCLGRTKDGSPRHPLYLKSGSKWEIFQQ